MHADLSVTSAVYQARRLALNERLAPGLMILPTARAKSRNADSDYQFRFDSSFHYLSGFAEQEAVIVQVLGDAPKSILFCLPKDESREIWEGFLYGPEAAREAFGFDEAYSIDDLDSKLYELMTNQPRLYYPLGADKDLDSRVLAIIDKLRHKARTGVTFPTEFVDVRGPIGEMRLFKDTHELAIMRAAARISSEAHIRAMQATRPGMMEYEIEAEILHHFCKNGSRYPAYGSIVAGGKNATCLHYNTNTERLNDGELLLIDAGCELNGYASDITRTFPINGKFSGPQKDIYELVLAAMNASFSVVKPGALRISYHDIAIRTLTQGMVDLGILHGTVDGLIESEAYKQFYMHGTGHWLGLDVHDAGDYLIAGQSRPFEAGMALTVEPGLYFRPGPGVPEQFLHIGVRIEDDIVVTADGYENLTAATPKTVAAIEAVMAEAATIR